MNYEIYCDESCWEALYDKSAHRFAVIGGLWIPADKRQEFKQQINTIRAKYNFRGEVKWNHICPSTVAMYKELIECFFGNPEMRFRAICIEASVIDHDKYNRGNGELGFYKFYFQLLHHWMAFNNSYQIFLDYKVNGYKQRVQDLGKVLNNASTATVSQIQSLPSEESVLIQMADVMTGAVAATFNGGKSQSEAKQSIRNLIEHHLGHGICRTSPLEPKFNVFNINLQREW